MAQRAGRRGILPEIRAGPSAARSEFGPTLVPLAFAVSLPPPDSHKVAQGLRR